MTFGNIIFGGVIGVGVDAATGAMNEYPPSVVVILPPQSFPSIAGRDAFYEKVKACVSSQTAAVIAAVERRCAPDAAEGVSHDPMSSALGRSRLPGPHTRLL